MSRQSTTGPQKRCALPGNSFPIYRTAWNHRSLLKLCPFLAALPHSPHMGYRWLRWLKPCRTLAFPGAQSMSKGSHAGHTGLLSAPPAHYNGSQLGAFGLTFIFIIPTIVIIKKSESHTIVSDSLRPHGPYSPWSSPDQNTGVGKPFPSPGYLPHPSIEPRCPTLHVYS